METQFNIFPMSQHHSMRISNSYFSGPSGIAKLGNLAFMLFSILTTLILDSHHFQIFSFYFYFFLRSPKNVFRDSINDLNFHRFSSQSLICILGESLAIQSFEIIQLCPVISLEIQKIIFAPAISNIEIIS